MDRSAVQAQAARQNGSKSQGPTSVMGKAASAQNSRKHGLCSKDFVLGTEQEQAHFDCMLQELIFTHQAKNPLEKDACHHLAVAMWRRRVCDHLEKELLLAMQDGCACALKGGNGLPNLQTLNRYRARIARDLKEARLEIAELKQARIKAFEAELNRAQQFSNPTLLNELKKDLGETGFHIFRQKLTNEPEAAKAWATSIGVETEENQASPVDPQTNRATDKAKPVNKAEINRRGRRYLEKMGRKQNRKRSK